MGVGISVETALHACDTRQLGGGSYAVPFAAFDVTPQCILVQYMFIQPAGKLPL